MKAISLHISYGVGGDARSVLIYIETHPGMQTRARASSSADSPDIDDSSDVKLDHRVPEDIQPVFSSLSEHDQRRATSCASCLNRISVSDFRKATKMSRSLSFTRPHADCKALQFLLYHLPTFDA